MYPLTNMMIIVSITSITAVIAVIFAALAFIRSSSKRNDITLEQISQLLRSEANQIRTLSDEQARELRKELAENSRGFHDILLKTFDNLGNVLRLQGKEFSEQLSNGIKLLERKLADAATLHATASKDAREEMASNFSKLGNNTLNTLNQLGQQQKERLDNVSQALKILSDKQESAQETLKKTVESRLDMLRTENAAKLDEMRKTVDEKLQSTLETRLGESFTRVVEQLERVHKGIGEMQSLASGVGDLKKILSNVRVRGTFGEVQLAMLLEQFLSPEQFIKNAQIKMDSQERVEFAIKLPGRGVEGEVLLPIDAKFPQEDYERLLTAMDTGDVDMVLQASKELENNIKLCAKTIKEKYIAVPRTTEFAILFLPTESLYAEILRRPGLFEQIQRDYHVTLTGPTTLLALLNALQMGFRSIAIEKRSGEVWQILGAVSSEFGKYNTVVDRLSKQLATAARSVDDLGVRTRIMNKKLSNVEKLPDETAQILLGPALVEKLVDEEVGQLQ